MSKIEDPRELRDLLGAYALGAVSTDERDQLEVLLATDAAARAELHGYERATALLRSGDGPGDAVWSRIEHTMLAEPGTPGGPASLAQHRWRRRTIRAVVAVAAAAALIAVALWGSDRLTSQSPRIQPTANLRNAAARAAAQRGSRRLELISQDRKIHIPIVVAANGRAFLLGGTLAGHRRGYTLVLYATTTTQTLLVHEIGPTLRVIEFRVPGGTLRLVLGETAGPGRPVTSLAQALVTGGCSQTCPGTSSGATTTPAASGANPVPIPSPPGPGSSGTPGGPGSSGSPGAGTPGPGPGPGPGSGGGLLPPITLPPLPPLPTLPALPGL